MGSSHFGTFIISPKVLTHQQILLTSCRESVRKGLMMTGNPDRILENDGAGQRYLSKPFGQLRRRTL